MRNLYYIAIEGPIGVGKTSLTKLLAEKLNARTIFEQFEENPFLADFYDDPERFAFQTQLYFLLQRYQQQQELRQVDIFHNLLITDYMFVKDRLFASLNLNEKELTLYETVANLLERNVINPDLVIYLQADTDTLMSNIHQRKRTFEKNMSRDYIDALNQVYNEYFFRYQDTPLLIINSNNIDFVNNQKDLEEIVNVVRQPIVGTKFFNRQRDSKMFKLLLVAMATHLGYSFYLRYTAQKKAKKASSKETSDKQYSELDIQEAEYKDIDEK